MTGETNAPTPDACVSVIMVSYRTGPDLFEAIAAVLAQPEVAELILIDNGNPDAVALKLDERSAAEPRLLLIRGQGNVGFAAGCNLGASRARSEFLLILNPDCVMPEGALGRLLEEGRRLSGSWLIGPRLLNPDGTEQAGSRRRTLTLGRAFSEIFQLYRLAPHHPAFQRFNLHREPLPTQTEPVDVISGACILLRAADYEAVGGMDEGFFLHVEDIDLCVRFAQRGSVYFCPKVAVTHRKSTSEAGAIEVEWHKTKGFFRYFRKHFSGRYPPGFIPLVNLAVLARFGLFAVRQTLMRAGRR